MKAIQTVLSELVVGESSTFRQLTLFPLKASRTSPRDYRTLDEALEAQGIEISEVSEGGSVPDLLLDNRFDQDVLLIDGEELTGAKQNRVLNVTVLAAANHKTRIPVSCVEAGRWAYRRRNFTTSGNAEFAESRAHKMASVSESMMHRNTRQSDQSGVWGTIAGKAERMACYSETSAMDDIYREYRQPVEDYVAAFEPEAGQTGAAFAVDGKIKGIEIFEDPAVFCKLLPKLVRSYALDAVEVKGQAEDFTAKEAVTHFINRVAGGKFDIHSGAGKGSDVRIAGDGLTAGALVSEGRLLHLAAFQLDR